MLSLTHTHTHTHTHDEMDSVLSNTLFSYAQSNLSVSCARAVKGSQRGQLIVDAQSSVLEGSDEPAAWS